MTRRNPHEQSARAESPEVVRLREMGERIATEDNRCTAWPIYVVQRRVRVYGFDPDYGDDETRVWLHSEGHEADEEERKPLDEAWNLGNDIPDGWNWRIVVEEESARP